MPIGPIVLIVAFALLFTGLLCLALSQHTHFRHPLWAGRLNRIGLKSTGARRAAGIVALLASAGLMATTEGWGFGLVLWVMAAATVATLLAWTLAISN